MDKLARREREVLNVWKKPQEIKKIFAPNLTDTELQYFMGLSISLQANPFKRELWPVKYGNQPLQAVIGRDFYRRKAQEQPNYKGHIVDCVREGDSFQVKREINLQTGEVKASQVLHEYGEKRGKPLGAYCLVMVENRLPTYVFCEVSEYIGYTKDGKPTKFWNQKPETMIKKCAEAQGLRSAFQGIFEGTYDESELSESPPVISRDIEKDIQEGIENGWTLEQDPPNPELEKLYQEIDAFFDEHNYHHRHRTASLKKHLGIESLRECRDVEKLKKYLKEGREKLQKKTEKVKEKTVPEAWEQEQIESNRHRVKDFYGDESDELKRYNEAVESGQWQVAFDLVTPTMA